MADPVASILALSKKLDLLEYDAPGIFTNAIISKPEVTTLIRDALVPEQNLYRIASAPRADRLGRGEESKTDLRPERIDGQVTYIEPNFADWKTTAVRVPQLVQQAPLQADTLSSPSKRRSTTLPRLIPASVADSGDVDAMCDAVQRVVEQYPSLANSESLKGSTEALRAEHAELQQQIAELEQAVEEHKLELEQYSDSVRLPSRGTLSPVLDIDQEIEKGEREVALLEEELRQRTES